MPEPPLFVITIDTEGDNEWARPRVPTTQNSRFIPRFHEFCWQAGGFKVTYLLTLEMAEDPFLAEYLAPRQRDGQCEVGAHLHPWNTPPLIQCSDDDLEHQPYLYEYPEQVQRQKLATLVEAIERNYGARPTSYNAGRWGLDGVHVGILDDLGFRADTSVCPGVNWGRSIGHPDGRGGPDFNHAPVCPYPMSRDDVNRPGSLELWELPPTIVFYGAIGRRVPGVRALYGRVRILRSVLDRLGLGMQWLRPYPHMTVDRLKRVVELARQSGTPLLNLTFHSSELMPAGSPYNPTEEAIEGLYERLGGLFSYLRSQKVRCVTLAEARDELAARPGAASRA